MFKHVKFSSKRARATLSAEREAFEQEKSEYAELHRAQQAELSAMMESHRSQNEEWVERTRGEMDAEKKQLAEEKVGGEGCPCVDYTV